MGKGKKENSQSLAAKFEFYSCSGVDLCASLCLVKHMLGLSSRGAEIQFAETAGHVAIKRKGKKKQNAPGRESSNWVPCVKIISVVIIQVFLFVIIIVVSIQQLKI